MLSTYICHPAMGNNETSGIVVAMKLAKWIKKIKRRFSYRILFIPETIGSITYLSLNNNYKNLKENVIAGFQITCVGDNNSVSYLKSKYENTLPDKVVKYYLDSNKIKYNEYSYLERGSDERQWSSPGIDLPFVSLMRSKYLEYPEYHTSLDDINFISELGLEGGYNNIKECLKILELNKIYISTVLCEPQLGKRDMYPKISTTKTKSIIKNLTNFLTYCDGNLDVIEISLKINVSFNECINIVDQLLSNQLIRRKMFKNQIKSIIANLFNLKLNEIKKFEDIHKGEECYIIGGGNSLKYMDFKNFNDKKTSVNELYSLSQ